MRNDIVKNGLVRCPAFSVPLLAYREAVSSDDEDYGDLEQYPSIVRARKNWKKIYKIIMDRRTDIPLKQMAIKAKHEFVLHQKM